MGELVAGLFKFDLYKRTQGKLVRQVTFAAFALIVALGCWALHQSFADSDNKALQIGLPALLLALGLWVSFRLIQAPTFADFLIAVESEMNKVAWPKRGELYRASLVVILMIFILAGLLFGYDLILQAIPQLWQKLANWLAG